jgi:dipeptide/tripeptide permease
MTNLFLRFFERLKFWLFEEREDKYAENPKRRKQLHNAYLIQAWAALTGIVVIAIVPLVVWLITLQDFVIVYLILSAIAAILYVSISLYIRRLNRQFELGAH